MRKCGERQKRRLFKNPTCIDPTFFTTRAWRDGPFILLHSHKPLCLRSLAVPLFLYTFHLHYQWQVTMTGIYLSPNNTDFRIRRLLNYFQSNPICPGAFRSYKYSSTDACMCLHWYLYDVESYTRTFTFNGSSYHCPIFFEITRQQIIPTNCMSTQMVGTPWKWWYAGSNGS